MQPLLTAMTFDAPKDKVWPLLISEIGMKYPVRDVEKDSGVITTDTVSLNAGFNNAGMGNYVNPPRTFLATWDGLRVSVSALVTEPEPGKSHVKLRTHYQAFENNVYNSWLACDSNGGLEKSILDRIYSHLAATVQPASATAAPAAQPVNTTKPTSP